MPAPNLPPLEITHTFWILAHEVRNASRLEITTSSGMSSSSLTQTVRVSSREQHLFTHASMATR